MAQINKPTDYFNTLTWTGNGTNPRSLTGVGFQPDLVWSKRRNDAAGHNLFDVIRGTGANAELCSSSAGAEGGNSAETYGYLNSFDSDGFSVQTGSTDNTYWNTNTHTYVSWNWLAGGTASSNTDGSTTVNLSVNTTSGFSIGTYTGTSASATMGHGLGAVPHVIIVKNRDSGTRKWAVWHKDLSGNNKYLSLNQTSAELTDSATWDNTAPTSTVWSAQASGETNQSGEDFVFYAFTEKKGFSKAFSYTGNGSTSGTFTYLGFRPAWIMVKRTDSAGTSWVIHDSVREPSNPNYKRLHAELSDAEYTSSYGIDMLSNGFRPIVSDATWNASGGTYIGLAFAANPLVGTNNIPSCAV